MQRPPSPNEEAATVGDFACQIGCLSKCLFHCLSMLVMAPPPPSSFAPAASFKVSHTKPVLDALLKHFRPALLQAYVALVACSMTQMEVTSWLQIVGGGMFCWASICIASLVLYTVVPDKASLPSMLLAMVIGSLAMGAVIRALISDRCRRQSASEDVQEHICASMRYGFMEPQPKFRRVQMRRKETAKGTKSTTTVLEEVDVLWLRSSLQATQTCVCCLEEFDAQDMVSLLPCGHIFHETCHADWHALKKATHACPICRDLWANV